MKRLITVTATHPRSGWTRLAGTLLPLCEGPSTADTISEFDALQCIEAGQGEWVVGEVPPEAQPQRRK